MTMSTEVFRLSPLYAFFKIFIGNLCYVSVFAQMLLTTKTIKIFIHIETAMSEHIRTLMMEKLFEHPFQADIPSGYMKHTQRKMSHVTKKAAISLFLAAMLMIPCLIRAQH